MINRLNSTLRMRLLLFVFCAFVSTPTLADHLGPSAFGGGGGASVFGPGTLDEGHWAAGLRLTYNRPERRSDTELATLAAQHVHAHNTDYNVVGAVGLAYGVTHELTVSAELPYLRRDGLREGTHVHSGGVAVNGVEQLGNISGIGDLSLLAKYRLPGAGRTTVALIGGIKMPTGSTRKRSIDGERLETEHQPGTGSWDPIVGASLSTPAGWATLTASGLYQFSSRGAQRTRLGNRLQGGIALSHRFGEEDHSEPPSHTHHHGDELDEGGARPVKSSWDLIIEFGGEWEGRQKVAGEVEAESGGKWAYVAPGLRFNAASGWSATAALALPVWQRIRASHPDNGFRLTLSAGRVF